MPDVNMASHEWRTEECEQFVILFCNHPCLYNTTSKDYKDKNKGVFKLDATAQYDSVIHDALVLGHMLINQRIKPGAPRYNFYAIATLLI